MRCFQFESRGGCAGVGVDWGGERGRGEFGFGIEVRGDGCGLVVVVVVVFFVGGRLLGEEVMLVVIIYAVEGMICPVFQPSSLSCCDGGGEGFVVGRSVYLSLCGILSLSRPA